MVIIPPEYGQDENNTKEIRQSSNNKGTLASSGASSGRKLAGRSRSARVANVRAHWCAQQSLLIENLRALGHSTAGHEDDVLSNTGDKLQLTRRSTRAEA